MLAIDHIVIAAKDPETAAKNFGQKHHVTVTEGGKHTDWGTYNYLAYFRNDCYIEWLGIFDEATAARSKNPLVHLLFRELAQGQEGPVQYALRIENIDDAVFNLQTLGTAFTGPIPGSRSRPDGSRLKWQMLFPEATITLPPFLIEWSEGSNTPQDAKLINDRAIHKIFAPITDTYTFSSVYQVTLTDHTAQLDNAVLQHADNVQYVLT